MGKPAIKPGFCSIKENQHCSIPQKILKKKENLQAQASCHSYLLATYEVEFSSNHSPTSKKIRDKNLP